MSEATENNPIVGQDGPLESERSGDHAPGCRGGDGFRCVCQAAEPGPYAAAVAAYLELADWLDDVLDGPVVVHARSIAVSLDRQLAAKGEVQSALAGSFDKCLLRLNERRPKPAGEASPVPAGQTTVFDFLDG